MLASYGTNATAGSRFKIYGGLLGSEECRYELILCTKVDLPAPAMPIVMIHTGFFLSTVDVEGGGSTTMCGEDMFSMTEPLLLIDVGENDERDVDKIDE